MPCPFETARTTDFDFSQWLARIIFSCYLFYPLDAMFENLILPANVPPVITSTLFHFFLLYQAFGCAYFRSEKGLPSVMLSNQFLEGSSEM